MTEFVHPRLRPGLQAVPTRLDDNREVWVLSDPEGLAEHPVAVTPPLGEVLGHLLDGTRDLAAIRRDWEAVTGFAMSPEELESILGQLHAARLLEGEYLEAARDAARVSYRAERARPARFAGESYPAQAERLRESARAWRDRSEIPPIEKPVVGVLAPHIDPRGGGPCHGAAMSALAASPAEVFVILGTAHQPLGHSLVFTVQDFATPLGDLKTDRELVEHLAARTDGGGLEEEYVHLAEHSVEFQAVWLRVLHASRPGLRVVPVLVASQRERILAGRSIGQDPEIEAFVAALRELRETEGQKVALVASVDMSHVGPAYDGGERPTPEMLEQVMATDRRLLERAAAVDAEGWFAGLHAERNVFNVCGGAPTYVLLAALADDDIEGRLLRHDLWEIDSTHGSYVSFASIAYTEANDVGGHR